MAKELVKRVAFANNGMPHPQQRSIDFHAPSSVQFNNFHTFELSSDAVSDF